MRRPWFAIVLLGLAGGAEAAAPSSASLTPQAINEAAPSEKATRAKKDQADPFAIKVAVLLTRARFSPGMIDGRPGENLTKALKAFQGAQGLNPSGDVDRDTWDKLSAISPDPVVTEYEVSPADVKGPFLEKIPAKMEDMVGLKQLSYRNARELLAEKFHMSEALLTALNPRRDLEDSGTKIVVANVAGTETVDRTLKGKVARIEIAKSGRQLQAFDTDGKLLAFYPASVGSEEKPAPSGSFEVRSVAQRPTYTYDPAYAFKGVKSDKKFTIAAGPNNPVGVVWIDLSAKSYGIHGTPEPEKVGKSYSHGCVRLTNWDVEQLAFMVHKGTAVEFKDE